jgi:hypothetical protein
MINYVALIFNIQLLSVKKQSPLRHVIKANGLTILFQIDKSNVEKVIFIGSTISSRFLCGNLIER